MSDQSLADVVGDRRAVRVQVEFVDVAEYLLLQVLAKLADNAEVSEDSLRRQLRARANCRRNDVSAALERLLEGGDLLAAGTAGYRLSPAGRKRIAQPDFGVAQNGNPWRLLDRQHRFRLALQKATGRDGVAP